MARYGSFRYSEQKYGTDITTNLLWALEVDWNGDGIFTGANESRRMIDIDVSRGRNYYINPDGVGFQRVGVGQAIITLDNYDRRYDPFYTGSPLYPYILPGRHVKLAAKTGTTGTKYPVLYGRIADIKPISGINQVKMTVVDDTQILMDEVVSMTIQTDAQVDDLINLVLDEVGWPAADRSIEGITDTIPYWWADGVSAWNALNELAECVLGQFFISADGKATFYSRSHSSTPTVSITQEDIHTQIDIPQPYENIRNAIKINIFPRVEVATKIWELQDKTPVSSSDSVEIWAEFSYNDIPVPAVSVTTPVATSDYTMNTAADGSGSDLTSDFDVVIETFAKRAKLTITNNSASAGYITLFKLNGTAAYVPNTFSVESQGAASIAIYKKRSFLLESDWFQDTNLANTFVDYLSDSMPLVRAFPQIQMEFQPSIQFPIDLFTRVSLSIPYRGINNAYAVGSIEHKSLSDNLSSILTTVRMEPIPPATLEWVFPVQLGVDSYFAF
jgi:hypothetical protein